MWLSIRDGLSTFPKNWNRLIAGRFGSIKLAAAAN
jgi:hypothetical protein